uniref:Golgi-associated RAB2 interactor protein 6-like n=1 Tax=Euleptes europaea TaxID=460621 RepID=UPI002541CC4F|nr:Golgi-associated RAB2 interactor protein 6-like [Euleptes europaea]
MRGSKSQIRSRSRSQLPGSLARGDHDEGLFSRGMGPLQRQLSHGEYDLLRLAPMLESDFLQVSKLGEVIDVHNQVKTMTVAVACTRLQRETPDVLLLARPVVPSEVHLPPFNNLLCQYPPLKAFELTRLLPLRFVKISVHNQRKQQLRFKLASGRAFYLQLCPQPDQQEDLFELWVKAVNLLSPPSEERPKTQVQTRDPGGRGEAPAQRPEVCSYYL